MGRIPPWSDLPPELLSAIAESLLSNPIDILSFRTVCKSWYSSLSLSSITSSFTLSPPLPLIIPSPHHSLLGRYALSIRNLHILSVTTIYALRSPIDQVLPPWIPRAWVCFLDQSNPGKVSIRQPFSRKSYSLPFNFPRHLNLLNFHASELGRFYNLSYLPGQQVGKFAKPFVWSGVVRKVVLIGLVVVVLSSEGKLGLLKLSLGNENENLGVVRDWEIVHDGRGFRFDDIVEFKGRVLGVDRRGRVYEIVIGESSSTIMRAIGAPIAGGGGRRKRLVESLGRLYLAVRCIVGKETSAKFKVYELNEDTIKWVEVKSLGDRTFFVGVDFSFSAPAEELHGSCGKNGILFVEHSFASYDGYDGDYALFRQLKSDTLSIGVWHLEDAAHLGVIGSHLGYSNMLWPPPSWVWPKDKSERLNNLLTGIDQLQARIPDEKLKCFLFESIVSDPIEAKFAELPPLQQEAAIILMKQGFMMKEHINQVREFDDQMKEVKNIAVSSMQQHNNSENLHNQVGTSIIGTVETCASADPSQTAIKPPDSGIDWYIMEMYLNKCILHIEENTSEFEALIKSQKFPAIIE